MSAIRKSSRLQTKGNDVTYVEPTSGDESREGSLAPETSDDDIEEAPRPGGSKRKRGTRKVSGKDKRPAKRLRGKRGLLERMTELPMDLLFEVRNGIFLGGSDFAKELRCRSLENLTHSMSCIFLGRPKHCEPFL
jgi:hypothetical protein